MMMMMMKNVTLTKLQNLVFVLVSQSLIRNKTGEERLTVLALMAVHKDISVVKEKNSVSVF